MFCFLMVSRQLKNAATIKGIFYDISMFQLIELAG